MKRDNRFFLTLVIFAFTAMSCELPFELGEQALPTAIQALPTLAAQPTFVLPSALPASTPTPIPTLPPALPTATRTPAVNLSGAVLKLADLPAGFQELDAATQAQIGLTQENLAQSFQGAFRQAKSTSMSAFISPALQSFEVIVSLVFYPLTPVEISSFDLELSDPAKALTTFGQGFGSKTEPLAGTDKFGNASIGMTFTTSSGALVLRGDTVLVRRENAVAVILTLYRDGSKPPVPVATLCPILDGRVKTGLGK